MDIPVEIRRLIITHHQDGKSIRAIAEIVHLNKSTVYDIVQLFKDTGDVLPRRAGRCGRHRILTGHDERALARASVTNPHLTAREIRAQVGGRTSTASISTVKLSLRRQGRHSYRPHKSPSLNAAQRRTRLKWCKKYQEWDEDKWKLVSCC